MPIEVVGQPTDNPPDSVRKNDGNRAVLNRRRTAGGQRDEHDAPDDARHVRDSTSSGWVRGADLDLHLEMLCSFPYFLPRRAPAKISSVSERTQPL